MINDAEHGSPEENVCVKIVIVDRLPHLCIFALKDIQSGDELRYDYGIADLPWRKKVKRFFLFTLLDSKPSWNLLRSSLIAISYIWDRTVWRIFVYYWILLNEAGKDQIRGCTEHLVSFLQTSLINRWLNIGAWMQHSFIVWHCNCISFISPRRLGKLTKIVLEWTL